jgi:hypothetical protein
LKSDPLFNWSAWRSTSTRALKLEAPGRAILSLIHSERA